MVNDRPHVSVLKDETLRALKPKDGAVYVDGTFGAGGHARSILEAADCHVIGIDQDPYAEQFADALKEEFGDRFTFISGRFGDMNSLVKEVGIEKVDGVLLDIGVSSMQLDEGSRGFSFQKAGPLDMRMQQQGQDALSFLKQVGEEELADIIYHLGDERRSRRIARIIKLAATEDTLHTTLDLADAVKRAVGNYGGDKIHPATRTFQAIRIHLNEEFDQLREGLLGAEELLVEDGVLAVITFHSGEDAIVKQFVDERIGKSAGVSRYMPEPVNDNRSPSFMQKKRKPIAPSDEEIRENPRARSSKLRVAYRTAALPFLTQGKG